MPFPITCAACQKTFSIADDVYERKVKGRVVTIKCKQCQASIRVDSTKDTPDFSVADLADARPAAPALVAALPANASGPGASSTIAAATPTPAATALAATPATPATPATFAPVALKVPPGAAATVSKAAVMVTAAKTANPVPVTHKGAPASAIKTPLAVKASAVVIAPKASTATGTSKSSLTGVAPIPSALAAQTNAAVRPPTLLIAATPPAPPAMAPVIETLWAVEYPDGEDRELTQLQIKKELTAGAINSSTLVWRDGMDEWLELGQVPELQALNAAPKSKAEATPPVPTPQRLKAPSTPGLGNMPAQRPKAATISGVGDAPPQRAKAPFAPEINFASSEPKVAPPVPSIPKSTPSDARAPSPPVFSRGSAPSAALAPRALQTSASAAPEPPAFVPAAALIAAPFARRVAMPIGAVAPVSNLEDWPRKSRVPLIIGGVVLLAGALLVLFLTRSSADDIPPPTAIGPLPATLPSTARPAEPSPVATTDDANAAGPVRGSNAALQPSGNAALATPNAGFAELFASGARAADERHAATGTAQRFDANAAKIALAGAASEAPACQEKGGPAGKATVVVTFEPSGKVSSATVSDPPFAGTASGACIAAAMKRATVPAFSGLPGTVTKIISLQ